MQTAVPLTGPSHATILTGQYPPAHGVRGNVVFTLGSRYPTLATLLKRQGYQTAAFVGAYPVAAAFGFNQGFDTFNEEFHESSPGEPGAERRANEVADAALRWLEWPARRRARGSRSSRGCISTILMRPTRRRLRIGIASRAIRMTAKSRSPTRRSAA